MTMYITQYVNGRVVKWKWVGEIDNCLLRNRHPKATIPWYIVRYARRYDCDTTRYAIAPLAPVIALFHWWKQARWCLEYIGILNEWYFCEPGYVLSTGRWNFPWRKP